MRVDAHQHFWRYVPGGEGFEWIDDSMAAIRRSFAPEDLAPELDGAGIDGSVAVQAAQSLDENRFLLELASASPRILAVVGWVDLRDPRVGHELDRWQRYDKLRGIRRIVQAEPAAILLDSAFQSGVQELTRRGLGYDVLIHAGQLAEALQLVRSLPDQPFVIDHVAKPRLAEAVLEPWASQMHELGRLANVYCKVSGLVTEAAGFAWTPEQLRPYLDVVFESFPPERLMFGSDWPVCLVAATYGQVYRVIEEYARHLSPASRDALFGGTAAEFYCLPC